MQAVAIDSVAWCVCQSVTRLHRVKIAKQIEVMLEMETLGVKKYSIK